MKYDVLVYGPLFCDLIFTGLPGMPELGTEIFSEDLTITIGGTAIVAAGLHRLGAKVGFIADLGNDMLSRVAGQMLDEMGIDRTLIRQHPHPLPQITVALSFPQDRAFVTRFEKPKTPVDLTTLLREHRAKHLHISSFLAALENPDAPHIAHEAGLTVSFDPGWDETALRDPRLKDIIAALDVFLPSESELCYIMDEDNIEQALAKAAALMPNGQIILKQGKHGATAYQQNHREQVAALPIIPIDTTGAGDSFDAGFLFQYAQGADLTRCLQYGAVCGALSTTKIGGATAAPTHEEVQQWLSKLPS